MTNTTDIVEILDEIGINLNKKALNTIRKKLTKKIKQKYKIK